MRSKQMMTKAKIQTIEMYYGAPEGDYLDGTKFLLKVDGEYMSAESDFGGFVTSWNQYISPKDIDQYGILND